MDILLFHVVVPLALEHLHGMGAGKSFKNFIVSWVEAISDVLDLKVLVALSFACGRH